MFSYFLDLFGCVLDQIQRISEKININLVRDSSFYQEWRRIDSPGWIGANQWSQDLTKEIVSQLDEMYENIPEEFYSESQLPVITPDNFEEYLQMVKRHGPMHFQERCSGSGRPA